MNNLVVLPIALPILAGVLMVFFRKQVRLQKGIGLIFNLTTIGFILYIIQQARQTGIQTLSFGGWKPPFGIVLVGDMLSLLLVLTTYVVAIACLTFAFGSIGRDRESHLFYPFVQFLLAGVSGSFLTGDLFNLFVFFEVMLMSSYALIVLGGTKLQLRESLKYLLFNVLSSILFVVATALLYGAIGTLNMAHIAERVASADQTGLLTVISLLFMIVFSLKASLLLYFWLPGSYSAPPAAVQAIFTALLTKVGIYSLIRVFSLIFIHEPQITHQLIGWLAALTMVLGMIGVIAYRHVQKVLIYNIIVGVGFVVLGLAVFSQTAFEGVIYYLIHDMVAKALLFMVGGMIIMLAGSSHLNKIGGLMKSYPGLGWTTLITAFSIAGIPPLSGFIGKLLIVQGSFATGRTDLYWFAGIGLLSSLLLLFSLVRLFMEAFWKEAPEGQAVPVVQINRKQYRFLLMPCAILLIISIGMGLAAEWIYPYVQQAAETLADPSIYIKAVLKE